MFERGKGLTRPWRSRSAAPQQDEDIEQKPTPVELFSDLVFVVAMHIVAEPLEELDSLSSTQVPLYLLRVFSLWWMWHSAMLWANMANLLFEGDDVRVWHHGVLFFAMTMIVIFAEACKRNDSALGLLFYLAARVVMVISWKIEGVLRPRPPEMLPESYEGLMKATKVAPMGLMIEGTFLTIASWLLHRGQEVAALSCWGGLAATLLMLRTLYSFTPPKCNPFSAGQMAERYELIILICIGEIVFAAAIPGPYINSVLARCLCTPNRSPPCSILHSHLRPRFTTPCPSQHPPSSLMPAVRSAVWPHASASCCTSRHGPPSVTKPSMTVSVSCKGHMSTLCY